MPSETAWKARYARLWNASREDRRSLPRSLAQRVMVALEAYRQLALPGLPGPTALGRVADVRMGDRRPCPGRAERPPGHDRAAARRSSAPAARPAGPQRQGPRAAYAKAWSARNRQPGQHKGPITRAFLEVLEALLWGFHNAAPGCCFPSYEAIAAKAECCRDTVY